MPYIKKHERHGIDRHVDKLVGEIATPGQLNYAVTNMLKQLYPDPNYSQHNEIMGVLECIKLEWYRRYTGPLEDRKIQENGDVGKPISITHHSV